MNLELREHDELEAFLVFSFGAGIGLGGGSSDGGSDELSFPSVDGASDGERGCGPEARVR